MSKRKEEYGYGRYRFEYWFGYWFDLYRVYRAGFGAQSDELVRGFNGCVLLRGLLVRDKARWRAWVLDVSYGSLSFEYM